MNSEIIVFSVYIVSVLAVAYLAYEQGLYEGMAMICHPYNPGMLVNGSYVCDDDDEDDDYFVDPYTYDRLEALNLGI